MASPARFTTFDFDVVTGPLEEAPRRPEIPPDRPPAEHPTAHDDADDAGLETAGDGEDA